MDRRGSLIRTPAIWRRCMEQSSLGADSAAEEEREKIKKSETIHPQVSEIEM